MRMFLSSHPTVAQAVQDPHRAWSHIDECDTSNDSAAIDWTEEDVVRLHCLLLEDLSGLADPATPLEEKLDALRWVFTDPDKDALPFSFANCVRVAGCSPFSTFPYLGNMQPEDVRSLLQGYVKRWLKESLDRYPTWVRQAITHNLQWSAEQLQRNPQWINEQLKRASEQGDLFA
ncbi:hypothetical protein [Roseateles flavus]|uniref:Uncharacterized protein n=1 Tax=Roseateles flavus TaxID=3149041 RepID=A0ABV0GL07_9BURK